MLDTLCMLQSVLALKQYSFPSEHMMFNLAMKLLGFARFESCKTLVYILAWHMLSDYNMSGRSWYQSEVADDLVGTFLSHSASVCCKERDHYDCQETVEE